ncbi:MAG TPA: baseplate J/gp47 family protein [Kofleriaceae bacterium]|nr:baseplate J/gp47 family protein [Kofleriaceae bacterium]
MTRVPQAHAARSHARLEAELGAAARETFGLPDQRAGWDPTRSTSAALDLGRGLLDSVALALHVLWTYQQAWAEEGYLATARLPSSIAKLLGHLGYHGGPGAAATGLQHFRARAGTTAVLLPAGMRLSSAARGDEPSATFETLEPLRVDARLNELSAYLPPRARRPRPAPRPGRGGPPVPKGGLFGAGSAAAGLSDRIDAQRAGNEAERAAARARQDARHLSSLVSRFGLDTAQGCKDSLDGLCEALCEAQRLAAKTPPASPVGNLSESQEIVARQLRNLARRQRDALAELECAMVPCPGEKPEVYAKRLDCMAAFLDAFVGGLIQEARDQVVLLRGPWALSNLDRAFGPGSARASVRGAAQPGGDFLYLLPLADGSPPPVRPGDWMVVAEDVETIGPDGNATRDRVHREAIRIVRVASEQPAGVEHSLARIHFQPPLVRRYRLDRTVLIGNCAPVSEGATVVEELTPGPDRRVLVPSQKPLTWLRDPEAPRGRVPVVELAVNGRPWRRVDDLLAAGPAEPVFAVEAQPAGMARLRVGDGESGAPLPDGARVVATYRVGVGAAGNRAARRIDGLVTAHPAVESTFNPLPTTGGADPEPTASARARGPSSIGTLDRAVSVGDVEVLARDHDGVRRARVFRDPRRPRALAAVVCGPRGAALGAADLTALSRYLAVRVPPGITVAVENRVLVPIQARILLRYQRGADPISLLREARLRLGADVEADTPPGLLDPDRGELGDDLELSEIYAAVDGARGLHSMVVKQLHRADQAPALHERIVASPRQLLIWGDRVELAYEEGRDR